MWTSTLDLDPKRVLVTQLLRRIWRGACFSSFAPLQVQNLPRQPLPANSWVRVRNRLAGICGSDLRMVQVEGYPSIAPAMQRHSYPGHEVVGEVLEVGADVQTLNVGDRVALQYSPNCLSAGMQPPCRSCTLGHYNLCERANLPPPHSIGGGWSEEMLLHEQQLFRVPTDMNDEQAVLLEPASAAIHAALRHLPRTDERVLIVGSGTIGLLTLQVVRTLAPQAEVSVLARHPFQIEQATRLGATHIIYPQDSSIGIQRATKAQIYQNALGKRMLLGGYDVIYDTVGSPKTLHHSLRWARTQATIVLVGLSPRMMQIDLTPVLYQEVNLLGSMDSGIENWPLNTSEQLSTFEVAAELIKHGRLQPEHLITHRFPLNDYQAAIKTAMDKARSRAIKVVFDYSLLPASVVPNVRASAARKRRAATPFPEALPSHDEQTPEEAAFPLEALAFSTPVEPATTSATSPMAPITPSQASDDFDMMEDTLKSPAFAKQIKLPGTKAPVKGEDIHAQPTVAANMLELAPVAPPTVEEEQTMPIPQVQDTQDMPEHDELPVDQGATISPSEPEQDAYSVAEPPTAQETSDAIELTTLEEIVVEPSKDLPVDDATPATSAAETPATAQATEELSSSPALEDDPVASMEEMQIASEPPEMLAMDVQHVPEEESEQTANATPSEPPETLLAIDVQHVPESEQTADATPETPETPTAMGTQDEVTPEPFELKVLDEPTNFVEKEESKEIDESAATGEHNNALLHVENPANVQVQARPRARKKSGRTTQRGKK